MFSLFSRVTFELSMRVEEKDHELILVKEIPPGVLLLDHPRNAQLQIHSVLISDCSSPKATWDCFRRLAVHNSASGDNHQRLCEEARNWGVVGRRVVLSVVATRSV